MPYIRAFIFLSGTRLLKIGQHKSGLVAGAAPPGTVCSDLRATF